MRIIEVNDEGIFFDNGSQITFDHEQECCEYNYADFNQLDDIARCAYFQEPIEFEEAENNGFRFGNRPDKMFFIPCYSEQNGYYSSDVQILYNGKTVLDIAAYEIIE